MLYALPTRAALTQLQTAWLSKNRREWYKHHLRINYSTRAATFSSDPREARQRRLSGLEGPSSSALFQHSFPQPEELEAEEEGAQEPGANGSNSAAGATAALPPLQIPRGSDQKSDVLVEGEDEFVDAPSEPEDEEVTFGPNKEFKRRRSSSKTFVTASSMPVTADEDEDDFEETTDDRRAGPSRAQASGLQVPPSPEQAGSKSLGKRPLSNVESHDEPASTTGAASVDANSTSSLLHKTDVNKAPASADVDSRPSTKGILARVKRRSEMRSSSINELDPATGELTRKKSNLRNLVKFDIPEDSRRAAIHLKAKKAQMTAQRAGAKVRRKTIKDGLVVKMERMLVRVDAAGEDFDENVNQRVVSRVKDKWREYMVVCRHSHVNDADFVLQLYQTRVSQQHFL
jgi:hypothetical protein